MALPDDWLHNHRPWSPPIVQLAGGGIGHLLCWEKNERHGSWYAWVSWVQSTGDPVRHRHHVVSVRAEAVQRLENPDPYARVPRRVLGTDGQIRPWSPPGLSKRDARSARNEPGNDNRPSAALNHILSEDKRAAALEGDMARVRLQPLMPMSRRSYQQVLQLFRPFERRRHLSANTRVPPARACSIR